MAFTTFVFLKTTDSLRQPISILHELPNDYRASNYLDDHQRDQEAITGQAGDKRKKRGLASSLFLLSPISILRAHYKLCS